MGGFNDVSEWKKKRGRAAYVCWRIKSSTKEKSKGKARLDVPNDGLHLNSGLLVLLLRKQAGDLALSHPIVAKSCAKRGEGGRKHEHMEMGLLFL